MSDVALTTIQHGMENGKVVVVKEGEPVEGLPSDVVADLKEQGLIGKAPVVQEDDDDAEDERVADLEAQVAELRAKLAEASKSDTSKSDTPPAE